MLGKSVCLTVLTGLGLAITPMAHANEPILALGAKASTLGLGADGIARINNNLNARLGVQAFTYDISGTESGVDYDADLKLFSGLLTADWFPASGSFRISAGALINDNKLEMTGRPANGTYTIGDTTYTAAEVGTLNGTVDFNTLAPYLGVGWGNPFTAGGRWSFTCDIGVVFQGSPEVSYTVDGTLANDATFLAELRQEKQELEDELDNYKYYPMLAVGVNYRF